MVASLRRRNKLDVKALRSLGYEEAQLPIELAALREKRGMLLFER